jgi:hypothetical protein
MALVAHQIALNASTATPLLVQGTTGTEFENVQGSVQDPLPIWIKNESASIVVWIGGSAVTALTGQSIAAGAVLPLTLYGSSEIPYAIAASATPSVSVLAGRQ